MNQQTQQNYNNWTLEELIKKSPLYREEEKQRWLDFLPKLNEEQKQKARAAFIQERKVWDANAPQREAAYKKAIVKINQLADKTIKDVLHTAEAKDQAKDEVNANALIKNL